MTQTQQADVWARRDALSASLAKTKGKADRAPTLAAIADCNTELTTGNYNAPKPEVVKADEYLRPDTGTIQFP